MDKNTFKGEVKNDTASLNTASRDASFFHVVPSLVVCPKDERDVEALVDSVRKEKLSGENVSLTARSGGTDMSGGPLTSSIVVSLTEHLNHIGQIKNNEITVQPGAYYRDFEKETLKRGLLLPSYPASREICTVGGMVANNAGGEKTLTYGKTERYVKSLRMVLSDGHTYDFHALNLQELEQKKALNTFEGEIYRKMSALIFENQALIESAKPNVSKNSAGYYLWNVFDQNKGTFDLSKLIVGSQGTLGLITEITFTLVHPKNASRLLVLFLPKLERVAEVAKTLLPFKPESLESYDDHTLKVALKFLPELAKSLNTDLIKTAFAFLPELKMILTGGIPKLVIIAEFTAETDEHAAKQAREAQEAIKNLGFRSLVTKSAEQNKKYWTVRRESFNLLRHHTKKLRTAPFIDDFVVHPNDLSTFLPKLYAILDEYGLVYTVAGHVGNANFHIIPLMDLSKPGSKELIEKLSTEVYKLVISYRGSITGEHNDGLIRTPFLPLMFGPEIIKLFEETKKIFDPENIFNPGKKVGATLQSSLEKLDTTI